MPAKRAHPVPPRSPDPGGRSGIAYYRVSTSRQANTSFDEDGFSIQAQRDYCQRKAAELGVQLVDGYIDRGKSARTADRPALQAMLARIKDDTDIQYVLVHKLDRLARNREDDVQIGLLLAKQGVRLVSCTENIDNTPSGRLVHGIMADIAEWYSANLSQEAKKGMVKKAEIGGTPGPVPVGYENIRVKITELGKDIGDVRVHDTYAPIVTECFKLYDSGRYTLAEVAAIATDQGLRLPATRRLPARPLTRQSMQRLLRNRYYTGWLRFGGVDYRGNHPPLIDEATFDRVQALLDAPATSPRTRASSGHTTSRAHSSVPAVAGASALRSPPTGESGETTPTSSASVARSTKISARRGTSRWRTSRPRSAPTGHACASRRPAGGSCAGRSWRASRANTSRARLRSPGKSAA